MPTTGIRTKWTSGDLEFYDQASGTTMLRLGVGDKMGFFGVTPAVRPTAYTQTYATADKTHAALTATSIAAVIPAAAPAGGTGATAGAYDTAANRNSMITTLNDLRTWAVEMDLDYEAILVDLTDLKQLVNSVIDDLQSLGLAQ